MFLFFSKFQIHFQNSYVICHKSFIFFNNENSSSKSFYMIDDVQFRCDYHFHQNCIINHVISFSNARERCITCDANVFDINDRYMIEMTIENEFVDSINLNNDIDEQSFLKINFDVARVQIFFSLMTQMNFIETKTFLNDENEMKKNKLNPNVKYETNEQTIMHMIAYNNDVEKMKLLLKYETNKKIKNEFDQTIFDCAKKMKIKKMIVLLKK